MRPVDSCLTCLPQPSRPLEASAHQWRPMKGTHGSGGVNVSLRGPKLDDPKGNFLRSALCQRSSRLFESGRRRTTFPKTAASPRFLEKWCSSVLILTGAFQSSVSPANLWALRSKIAESSILPEAYGCNGFGTIFIPAFRSLLCPDQSLFVLLLLGPLH